MVAVQFRKMDAHDGKGREGSQPELRPNEEAGASQLLKNGRGCGKAQPQQVGTRCGSSCGQAAHR